MFANAQTIDVWHRFRARLSSSVRQLNPRTRILIEWISLINASALLCALVLLHMSFSVKLEHVEAGNHFAPKWMPRCACVHDRWSNESLRADILHISVVLPLESDVQEDRQRERPTAELDEPNDDDHQDDGKVRLFSLLFPNFDDQVQTTTDAIATTTPALLKDGNQTVNEEEEEFMFVWEDYYFSVEKGFLLLSGGARQRLNVSVAHWQVSTADTCWSPDSDLDRTLLDTLVGYETALLNELAALFGGEGYVYSIESGTMYALYVAQDMALIDADHGEWAVFKVGVMLLGVCVFMLSTALVSVAFRESQSRLLAFSTRLRALATQRPSGGGANANADEQLWRRRRSSALFALIVGYLGEIMMLLALLLGALFCVAELLDDRFVSVMALALVWTLELFVVVVARSPTTRYYLPRFFFALFVLYIVYFLSFPLSFHYLAFAALTAIVDHAILFFYFHYELDFQASRGQVQGQGQGELGDAQQM
jgi:Tumour-associated protein